MDRLTELVNKFEYEEAYRVAEKLLKTQETTELLETIALICVELGKEDQARNYLNKNIATSPTYNSYFQLAQLSTAEDALDLYMKGLAICDQKRSISSVYCSIAELYQTDLCELPEAEQKCEEAVRMALEADPQNPEAYQTQASLALIKQQPEEALGSLIKSISFWMPKEVLDATLNVSVKLEERELADMTPYGSRLATSKMLLELEQYQLALVVLRTLFEENDEDLDMLYTYAMAFWLLGASALDSGDEDKQGFVENYVQSIVDGGQIDESLSELWSSAYDILEEARIIVEKQGCEDTELLESIQDLYATLKAIFGEFEPPVGQ
jgi:tetratricopeptide (TPR) repeat protein